MAVAIGSQRAARTSVRFILNGNTRSPSCHCSFCHTCRSIFSLLSPRFFVGTIADCPSWLNELQQRLSLLELVFYFFRCGLRFRDPTLLAGPAHSSIGF